MQGKKVKIILEDRRVLPDNTENGHITESDLQIQYSLLQNSNDILYRTRETVIGKTKDLE